MTQAVRQLSSRNVIGRRFRNVHRSDAVAEHPLVECTDGTALPREGNPSGRRQQVRVVIDEPADRNPGMAWWLHQPIMPGRPPRGRAAGA